eukprot:PhF_6_TR15644/c0_g1_i2/m.24303
MSKGLVVITGASSGIGEATAKSLSALGHPLLLLARRIDRMTALNLPNTLCKKVDVTVLDEVTAAVKEGEALYGPCDLMVNNAGVMPLGTIDTQDPAAWDQMLSVNLRGVMNGYRAVVEGMKARKRGTILTISSIAAHKPFPNHSVYCGTKAAVNLMMETCRMECASVGVRVCIVSPGVVETELLNVNDKATVDAYKASLSAKLQSEDIAAAIVYAYQAPPHVCIREIVIGPTGQEP